jgi:hypothetical protein
VESGVVPSLKPPGGWRSPPVGDPPCAAASTRSRTCAAGVDHRGENKRANYNDRYVLAAQPGQVAGAAKRDKPRSKRIVQNGLPGCVL